MFIILLWDTFPKNQVFYNNERPPLKYHHLQHRRREGVGDFFNNKDNGINVR